MRHAPRICDQLPVLYVSLKRPLAPRIFHARAIPHRSMSTFNLRLCIPCPLSRLFTQAFPCTLTCPPFISSFSPTGLRLSNTGSFAYLRACVFRLIQKCYLVSCRTQINAVRGLVRTGHSLFACSLVFVHCSCSPWIFPTTLTLSV